MKMFVLTQSFWAREKAWHQIKCKWVALRILFFCFVLLPTYERRYGFCAIYLNVKRKKFITLALARAVYIEYIIVKSNIHSIKEGWNGMQQHQHCKYNFPKRNDKFCNDRWRAANNFLCTNVICMTIDFFIENAMHRIESNRFERINSGELNFTTNRFSCLSFQLDDANDFQMLYTMFWNFCSCCHPFHSWNGILAD